MRRVFSAPLQRFGAAASAAACAQRWSTTVPPVAADAAAAGSASVAFAAPESNARLEEFANMYAQLTLKEITALQRLIFKKLGHSDQFYEQALLRGLGGGGGGGGGGGFAAPAVAAGAPVAAAAAAPAGDAPKEAAAAPKKPAAAKSSFDVKLGKYPPANKLQLIKELRTITNLPLKEAKDAIDKAPGIIAKTLGKEESEKLKKLLEAHGAEIELI